MFEIRATYAAERDLEEIYDYLLGKFCSPQAWENLRAEIADAYSVLQENPQAFAECADRRLRQSHYRKCVLGGYLFIYRIDHDAGVVHVIRYFHHLQDYASEI